MEQKGRKAEQLGKGLCQEMGKRLHEVNQLAAKNLAEVSKHLLYIAVV